MNTAREVPILALLELVEPLEGNRGFPIVCLTVTQRDADRHGSWRRPDQLVPKTDAGLTERCAGRAGKVGLNQALFIPVDVAQYRLIQPGSDAIQEVVLHRGAVAPSLNASQISIGRWDGVVSNGNGHGFEPGVCG